MYWSEAQKRELTWEFRSGTRSLICKTTWALGSFLPPRLASRENEDIWAVGWCPGGVGASVWRLVGRSGILGKPWSPSLEQNCHQGKSAQTQFLFWCFPLRQSQESESECLLKVRRVLSGVPLARLELAVVTDRSPGQPLPGPLPSIPTMCGRGGLCPLGSPDAQCPGLAPSGSPLGFDSQRLLAASSVLG